MNEKDIARLKHENFVRDLQQQMSTPSGRRFVWYVLKQLLYNMPIMEANSYIYRSAAKQEVAFKISSDIKKVCLEQFHLMEKENGGGDNSA